MRTRNLARIGFWMFLGLVPQAEGHDTWLLAEHAAVLPGTAVLLNLTSGMAFPMLDYAIKSERLRKASVRLAGKTFELPKREASEKSLRLGADLAEPGVAAIWIELEPKSLELTPEQVREYLEEIGAPEELRKAWAAEAPPGKWRETYTKHAKTFVRVGEPVEDRSWAEPVGLGLELVPEADPTALQAGGSVPVRLLKDGAPLAEFAVGLVYDGESHGVLQTTDAEGRVVFQLPKAGLWMLRATELKPSTVPDIDWESRFTTLTFEVRTP